MIAAATGASFGLARAAATHNTVRKILSATTSKKTPIFEHWFNFLAKYPSTMSVAHAIRTTAMKCHGLLDAIVEAYNDKEIRKAVIKFGTNRQVRNFPMFHYENKGRGALQKLWASVRSEVGSVPSICETGCVDHP